MASLLQAILAVCLLSCVHGQDQLFLSALYSRCTLQSTSNILSGCSSSSGITTGASDFATALNSICTNIHGIVTYYGCVRTAMEACLPSEYHGLLLTDAETADLYQYICNHRNDVNLNCMANAISADSCTANAVNLYYFALNQTGLVQATCSYLDTSRACAFNFGASCSSHDRDIYDTYLVKSYPPACSGGATTAPTSFLVLGACAVLLKKVATVLYFHG